MTWTNPTRYPNSMEIADNEAFLNTNVIDNLIDHETRINTAGLVRISGASFTTATDVVLPADTFTAAYENYRIVLIAENSPTANIVGLRLRAGGTTLAAGYRYTAGTVYYGINWTHVTTLSDSYWTLAQNDGGNGRVFSVIDIFAPYTSRAAKMYSAQSGGNRQGGEIRVTTGSVDDATLFDTAILRVTAGTFSGSYNVYGYRS